MYHLVAVIRPPGKTNGFDAFAGYYYVWITVTGHWLLDSGASV